MPILRSLICLLAVLVSCGRLLADAPTTQATTPSTTQATSYKLERFSVEEPQRWEGWIVQIDLTDPKLQVAIGTGGPDPDGPGNWETILRPTSQIAKACDFDLAVNTVFFMNNRDHSKSPMKYQAGDWACSVGLVMDAGKVLTTRREGVPIVFDKNNRASIVPMDKIPESAHTIVSGNQQIVENGKPTDKLNSETRAPRVSVGVKDEGKTLVLFVIDGRRAGWSDGMTIAELGKKMADLGCVAAINLDGGGSTTLVAKRPSSEGDKYKVLNTPSDGSSLPLPIAIERPVPYVLGFRWR
jgi:hypothetical protein